MLLPKGFAPPEFIAPYAIGRKLCAKDVYMDLVAITTSHNEIKKYRGNAGDWPTPDYSIEENLIDLCWHQREFEFKNSFAFILEDTKDSKEFGCIYIYPIGFRTEVTLDTEKFDADISWWISKEFLNEQTYTRLSVDIKMWIETQWPFKNPYYSNILLPKEFYETKE